MTNTNCNYVLWLELNGELVECLPASHIIQAYRKAAELSITTRATIDLRMNGELFATARNGKIYTDNVWTLCPSFADESITVCCSEREAMAKALDMYEDAVDFYTRNPQPDLNPAWFKVYVYDLHNNIHAEIM